MPSRGERAYAYAKSCGIIGKSFTGSRARALRGIGRLSELDRIVFPSSSRDLPEKELLVDIEERLLKREIEAIVSVLDSYRTVPEFLAVLLQGYECNDVKNMLGSGAGTHRPAFFDLGRFGTVNISAWPDYQAMLKNTDYEFLLNEKGELDRSRGEIKLNAELDRIYYTKLWTALKKLPKKDRRVCEFILAEEISLRNSSWVLRLRTYYQMKAEETASHLIDIQSITGGKTISLAEDAKAILSLPLDTRQNWENWKRASFLNPDTMGWKANPRYFQNASSRYLYKLACKSFHFSPASIDSIFCFIKIKQFEEDFLTSSAEGIAMGMTSGEVFGILGMES